MTTSPDDTKKEPKKKGRGCMTKCCGTGSCEMKLRPLCFMVKITLLAGIVILVVQYI